jgi:ribonuclease HIII
MIKNLINKVFINFYENKYNELQACYETVICYKVKLHVQNLTLE